MCLVELEEIELYAVVQLQSVAVLRTGTVVHKCWLFLSLEGKEIHGLRQGFLALELLLPYRSGPSLNVLLTIYAVGGITLVSQNHSMAWDGRDLKDHQDSTPLLQSGLQLLDQVNMELLYTGRLGGSRGRVPLKIDWDQSISIT